MKKCVMFLMCLLMLSGCSSVKIPPINQYQLNAYSHKIWAKHPMQSSILVTLPEAVAGYETSKMLYMCRTYAIKAFTKNAWVDTPAGMLHPLLIESLQRSAYFRAVASVAYAEPVDYRLDAQLLKLQQNFIKRPSVIEFSAKVVLTDVKDSRILASHIINLEVPCPQDSPYGGVIAANKATAVFTAAVTEFVIKGANQ